MQGQKRFWQVLACVCFFSGITLAQVTTGTISGTVSDSTGAVIPGAGVTILNVDTGISRTVTTDAAGRYRAPQLGLGNYDVTTESSGFQTSVRAGITLTVGREATVDFTLQVGAVTERVTVTGEAPLVDTTSATVASLVDERQVRELPLSGRSYTDLTAIQPGAIYLTTVTPNVRTGGGRKISVNGARPAQTLYLLDGVETMNIAANMAPSSVLGRQLGTEAVREFNVLINNYGAQYGRAIGGVVNAVTQSGTNEWHGSAFEFLRNDKLDANDFFVPPGGPKTPLKQNQFGASLGGALRRDSTFFFLAYEGERARRGITDFMEVFDEDLKEGVITKHVDDNGNPLPVGLWKVDPSVILEDFRPVHPWTQAVLRELTFPGNGERLGGGTRRYAASRVEKGTENYGTARFDQRLSDSDSLFVRFTADRSEASRLDPGNDPDWTHFSDGAYYFATLQHTRILSPSAINVASVGFMRTKMISGFTVAGGLDPILPCIPGTPLCNGIAPRGTGIGGVRASDLSLPFELIDNTFLYQDQISYNRGNHSISAGAELKRYRMNEFQNIWFSGQMRTSGLSRFFSARPSSITGPVPQSIDPLVPPDVYRGYRQTFVGFYLQDDIKVLPNLTLNVGLRWEKMTDPSEVNGKAGSVRDILRDTGFTLGKVFEINADWKGFAPRFGFAWTPFGGGNTVVRAGWGVFTEWPLTYLYTLSSYIAPFADRVQIRNPVMPRSAAEPCPVCGVVSGDPAFASVRDPIINAFDWHPAYSYQWNFGLEQQLGQTFVAKVGYIGTRSLHLTGNNNSNPPVPVQDQDGRWYTPANAVPLNPNFGSFRYISNAGDGWYNALQLSMERRFSSGLGFRASFQWSRNLDTTGIGQQTADTPGSINNSNSYNIAADKGLASMDHRRNFTFNFNYELPLGAGKAFGNNLAGALDHMISGWQLNGVMRFRDGTPINISSSNRCSGNRVSSSGTDRPDLRPGASNNPVIEGKRDFRQNEPYFDATAFLAPPACFSSGSTDDPSKRGYFGNLGRQTLIGPGLVGTDFSIFKNFRVGEGKSLQFRAEFFNILNRPNFRLEQSQSRVTSAGRTFATDSAGDVLIDPGTGRAVPGGRYPEGRINSRAGRIRALQAGTTMRQIQLALKFTF